MRSLGETTPAVTQAFLESTPKRFSRWRGAAQAGIGAAFALVALAYAADPALAAGYWARDAYGYSYWVDTGPDPDNLDFAIVLFAAFLVSVVAIVIGNEGEKARAAEAAHTAGLPAEIATPQTVQHYQDQTARVLAYDHFLQAQAAQYRQYIETARLEAEAHELTRLIEDQRRSQGEGW